MPLAEEEEVVFRPRKAKKKAKAKAKTKRRAKARAKLKTRKFQRTVKGLRWLLIIVSVGGAVIGAIVGVHRMDPDWMEFTLASLFRILRPGSEEE